MKEKEVITFTEDQFIATGNNGNHEFVDLGLPSGLKWGTCNVGAHSLEEYGDYFAWGETETKEDFREDNYEHSCEEENEDYERDEDFDPDEDYGPDEFYFAMTKYGWDDEGEDVLELEDDAANKNWGNSWRMPTVEEFEELKDNCEVTFGELKGVKGYKVTGPNGNSIFFPAAGCYCDEGLYKVGEMVSMWSSSRGDCVDRCDINDFYYAYGCGFIDGKAYADTDDRYYGESVRPVTE